MAFAKTCSRRMAAFSFAALLIAAEGFLSIPTVSTTGMHLSPGVVVEKSSIARFNNKSVQIRAMPSNDSNNMSPTPGGGSGMDPGLKLLLCILIDLIGVASFAAPGLGEATDVAWAPISALLINYLFGNGVFTALAFVEELLPGFDIIPTATIAWFVENGNREPAATTTEAPSSASATESVSQMSSKTGKRSNTPDAIDVEVID